MFCTRDNNWTLLWPISSPATKLSSFSWVKCFRYWYTKRANHVVTASLTWYIFTLLISAPDWLVSRLHRAHSNWQMKWKGCFSCQLIVERWWKPWEKSILRIAIYKNGKVEGGKCFTIEKLWRKIEAIYFRSKEKAVIWRAIWRNFNALSLLTHV